MAMWLDVTQAPYNAPINGNATTTTTAIATAISDAQANGHGVYIPHGIFNVTAGAGTTVFTVGDGVEIRISICIDDQIHRSLHQFGRRKVAPRPFMSHERF